MIKRIQIIIPLLFIILYGSSQNCNSKNGKLYLEDKNGNALCPAIYDRIGQGTCEFKEGFAVVIKNEKFGFLNTTGVEFITCKFECALNFSEGLAAVKENNKWGFINKFGEYVIPNLYDSETATFYANEGVNFSNGIALVKKNGQSLLINKKGETITDCNYDRMMPFSEFGLAAVGVGDFYSGIKWGFINKNGVLVIPCLFSNNYSYQNNSGSMNQGKAPSFNENGYASVTHKHDYSHNVIDTLGRTLVPWCKLFVNPGGIISIVNGKFGVIDENYKIVINPIYDDILLDNHERIYCTQDIISDNNSDYIKSAINARGYWNVNGAYSDIRDFNFYDKKIFCVLKNKKWGYINNKEETIIPFIYDQACSFKDGKAMVIVNGKEFHIDQFGNKTN